MDRSVKSIYKSNFNLVLDRAVQNKKPNMLFYGVIVILFLYLFDFIGCLMYFSTNILPYLTIFKDYDAITINLIKINVNSRSSLLSMTELIGHSYLSDTSSYTAL